MSPSGTLKKLLLAIAVLLASLGAFAAYAMHADQQRLRAATNPCEHDCLLDSGGVDPEWNPFFTEAVGQPVKDATLEVSMQPVGKGPQSFSPKVLEVTPNRRLVWRGRLIMPGVFDGTHYFTIEPRCDGSVRFVQVEEFGGMLVPFASFGPYRQGWIKMNEALKRRAEREQPTK